MLHGMIFKDDFKHDKVSQCWNNIAAIRKIVATTLIELR